MPMKTKAEVGIAVKTKSPILETGHETALDLHRLVLIDQRKMRKFDVLCLAPQRAFTRAAVSGGTQSDLCRIDKG